MARLFDDEEFQRWYRQAEHTLGSAEKDIGEGDYSWACFKCQQAGEYALKALLRGYGEPAYGHSIVKLVENLDSLGITSPSEVTAHARSLDRHYIPARYPNAYPQGSPFEFYDQPVANEALNSAKEILRFIYVIYGRSLKE